MTVDPDRNRGRLTRDPQSRRPYCLPLDRYLHLSLAHSILHIEITGLTVFLRTAEYRLWTATKAYDTSVPGLNVFQKTSQEFLSAS